MKLSFMWQWKQLIRSVERIGVSKTQILISTIIQTVWAKFVLNMTNGVIRGVGDSISDNNKVWDGTPKETTIKLEIRCLKSRSSFLLSNFRWICLSFLIGMRLTFPDCKKIKANNPETMDTKRKPRVWRYIETTSL